MDNRFYEQLKLAIRESWNKDTCYLDLSNQWSTDKPEIGQCAVTALLVQEKLGGKIAFNKNLNHYWNILDSGVIIDLTKSQFPSNTIFSIDSIKSRKSILFSAAALKQKTRRRFLLLKKRVEEILHEEKQLSLAY